MRSRTRTKWRKRRDQRRKKIPRTGVAIWTASDGSGDRVKKQLSA